MFHVLFSRLSVATVVTLLVFVVSASLQPAAALASPGVTAELRDSGSYLDNEWDNGNNGNNSGNEWDGGGQGIFFSICGLPWFAAHPACTGGVLGLAGG